MATIFNMLSSKFFSFSSFSLDSFFIFVFALHWCDSPFYSLDYYLFWVMSTQLSFMLRRSNEKKRFQSVEVLDFFLLSLWAQRNTPLRHPSNGSPFIHSEWIDCCDATVHYSIIHSFTYVYVRNAVRTVHNILPIIDGIWLIVDAICISNGMIWRTFNQMKNEEYKYVVCMRARSFFSLLLLYYVYFAFKWFYNWKTLGQFPWLTHSEWISTDFEP